MDDQDTRKLDLSQQLKRGKRLLRHVLIHYREDRCLDEAASLSYTSLLSLVPLLAVVFGVIAAFPVFSVWSDRLQQLIVKNFMPATGEVIVPYLETFLSSVTQLTLPGMMFLILTALLLMIRIEVVFNRIWRVDRKRTLLNRVIMYWAVLTLGPILIAAGLAFAAQNVMTAIGVTEGMSPGFYRLAIIVLTWAVFVLVFIVVPYRNVQFKHAAIGAALTTLLFELAKGAFVGYAANTNYTVIYGALAIIPIFLFWVYIVWSVILLGASLSASLTTFSDYSRYETTWPERWEFQMAFRLMGHFREAQKRGEALSRQQVLELETQASELQLLKLITRLREEHIITTDDDGHWLLARDLEDLSLADLYRAGDYYLPLGETEKLPRETAVDDIYVDSLEAVRRNSETIWTRSLRKMYLEKDGD